MKKIIFVFLAFFYTGSAFATFSLNGAWLGWADWNYEGSGTHCVSAQFSYSEDETKLTRNMGHLDCDYVSMDYPALVLEKKSNGLFNGDQKVGEFGSDQYSWTEIYSENVKINVTVKREANHLDYGEQWIDSKSQKIYDIHSRLFLKETTY